MTLIWLRLFTVPLKRVTENTSELKNKLKLFGIFGLPLINDIGQGLLGNCYMLATLASFA
jgi:hypothetical protein